MKPLIEKQFTAGRSVEYRISSDHPRTLSLALPGFFILMGIGIACFVSLAFFQQHQVLLILGFIASIAAAIGWMFFALHYGKRHFEKTVPSSATAKDASGTDKGNKT